MRLYAASGFGPGTAYSTKDLRPDAAHLMLTFVRAGSSAAGLAREGRSTIEQGAEGDDVRIEDAGIDSHLGKVSIHHRRKRQPVGVLAKVLRNAEQALLSRQDLLQECALFRIKPRATASIKMFYSWY